MADSSSSTSQAIVVEPNASLMPEATVATTSCKVPNNDPKTVVVGRESSRATTSGRPMDSGYVSAVTTPEKGTPENSVTGFPRPEEEFSLPPKLLRKPTRLTPFNKEVSKSTLERFDDLAILFSEPLYKCVSKGSYKHSPISMKCMVLGECESTAEPWIVVLCDVSVSKKVKKFFDQSWVKDECHPCDPKQPRFEYIIHNRAPRLITGTSVDVYGSMTGQLDTCMTSCGRLIQVGSDEETRLATLGGIIKLQHDYGVQLLGLTAAHMLIDEEYNWNSNDMSEDDDDDDDFSEAERNGAYLEEIYELDLGSDNDQSNDNARKAGPSAVELTNALSAVPMKPDKLWQKVGHLYAKSTASADSRANSDWALVELDDMRLIKPNLLIDVDTDTTREITFGLRELMIPSVKMGLGQSVEVMSGTNGLRHGHLSQSLSYLMSARARGFVQTYSLGLSDGLGLYPGDCGSWVVDKETSEVYGHVVASDVFKEAYIVPLHDTFQDIQRQLGARRVLLPDQIELEELSKLYNRVQAHLSQQSKIQTSSSAPAPSPTTNFVPATAQYRPKAAVLARKAVAVSGAVAASVSKPESNHPSAIGQIALTAPTPATTSQPKIFNTRKLRDNFKRFFSFRLHHKPSKDPVTQPGVLSHEPPQLYPPIMATPLPFDTLQHLPSPCLPASYSESPYISASLDLQAKARKPLNQNAPEPLLPLGALRISPDYDAYRQPTDSGYASRKTTTAMSDHECPEPSSPESVTPYDEYSESSPANYEHESVNQMSN